MLDPFIEALAARLTQPLPGEAAPSRFSPRPPRGGSFARVPPPDARQAAALILLYPTDALVEDVTARFALPLTVRRSDLPDHAGQISLPGGRIDTGETAMAAALREAEEEIGVDPSTVRILGSLTPLYVMVSRFVITPVVGVANSRPVFRPAEREVAELLEVPISQLSDRDNLRWGHRTRDGYLVDFPYFDIRDAHHTGDAPGHQVWGATAMVLGEFLSLFDDSFGPAS